MKSRRLWIAALGILSVLAIGAFISRPVSGLTGLWSFAPSPDPAGNLPPRAAIIDQVALTHPNPEFVDLASATLEVAGYQVDVYTGEQITVDFYRNLATHGYDLIVFRTHSSDVGVTGEIGLFTSEVYQENRWAMEQLRGRLAYGDTIPDTTGTNYFAVVSAFIAKEMRGQFDDTLLIIGGCESLASPPLAQAFIDKGASTVVGWNDTVDLAHNDRAILRLLLAVLGEKMSVEKAIRRTMIEVGPDPVYGSRLVYTADR
ncbi:MAG: hypothetical protein MAG451_01043 [Anaerolineales bacterium]|nr:hypothetical protein [Anaerolineales bacterium]